MDNALDAGATCSVRVAEGRIVVSDDGPGLEGDDAAVTELFSVGRPMLSTKRLRRVTRGALGNGLRVVAGAVLASGGRLWVTTRGRRLEIVPKDDGSSEALHRGESDWPGAIVEVELGGPLAEVLADEDEEVILRWARQALRLAPTTPVSECRSSPWWYPSDAFHALALAAAGDPTVRDLVGSLHGCTGRKAGEVAAEHRGRPAGALTLQEAEVVLHRARAVTRRVKPQRLGYVGKDALGPGFVHAHACGEYRVRPGRGRLAGEIPFIVECWARPTQGESTAVACVNRTPVVSEVSAGRQEFADGHAPTFRVRACGVALDIEGVGRQAFEVWVNVQCPALAFTTDGKSPDFGPLRGPLEKALVKAVRKAKRLAPRHERGAAADTIVREALHRWETDWQPQGIVPTVRQVFYALAVAGIVSKDDTGYERVGRALARAREAGAYPWEGIADPLREVRRVPTWGSLDEFLAEKRAEYRLDKWAVQPRRVELWTEKDALTGALAPIAAELEVPLVVARGYASATAKNEAAVRMRDGKPSTILYVGDFDPSGLDMSEGFCSWLREQLGGARHVEFLRLAVTEEDFLSGDYPTLTVNERDARARRYRERYGDELVETEALPPQELRARARAAVLARRDATAWEAQLDRERQHRDELARLLTRRPPRGRGRAQRSRE